MESGGGKISFLQACMILLLMNGLTNHVIVNPLLLDAAGRDSWISVLGSGCALLPWCAILALLMRRSGQRKLQPWLAERTHPAISWILLFPVCLQLYLIGGMTVVHTSTWTITNYLPASPKILLILTLTLLCALCAVWGLRVIAVTSGLLLPFVILLGFFVAISNGPEKNFQLLKPFVERGWSPVLDGMVYAGGGFVELVVLILMQHRIKTRVRPWQFMLFGLISLYIMIGPVIGAITEFGPKEAAKQLESPYEQWRLVKLGPYVEHVDFFSIYQWLSGASVRVSLALFLLAELLPFRRAASRAWFIVAVAASYVIGAMLPINEYDFYLWMYRVYFPYSLLVASSVSIVWFAVSLIKKPLPRREESA